MGSLIGLAVFAQKEVGDDGNDLQAIYINWSTPDAHMAKRRQLLSRGGSLTALHSSCFLCSISHSNSFNLWLKLCIKGKNIALNLWSEKEEISCAYRRWRFFLLLQEEAEFVTEFLSEIQFTELLSTSINCLNLFPQRPLYPATVCFLTAGLTWLEIKSTIHILSTMQNIVHIWWAKVLCSYRINSTFKVAWNMI